MKVGYIVPMSVSAVNGGIRTQALFTINHIKEYGIVPVLLSPWTQLENESLDIVHVFGASVENSEIIPRIKDKGIPVVLSPVFYANHSVSKINAVIRLERILSKFGKGIRSDFGIKSSLCHQSDLLLPNTLAEAKLIREGFKISEQSIKVIPNGVERKFEKADSTAFVEKYGVKDFVLFAGQASAPRKNVRLLLEAAPKLDVPVVIIGDFGDNAYSDECRKMANEASNVTLIPTLAHADELLSSAYAASRVFVLPSMYETPGIAALEAALTGSNIVITQHGGTKEYFKEYAKYIDPQSVTSLIKGIKAALEDKNPELKERILTHYTWEKVAQKTAEQYQQLTP